MPQDFVPSALAGHINDVTSTPSGQLVLGGPRPNISAPLNNGVVSAMKGALNGRASPVAVLLASPRLGMPLIFTV